ARSCRIPASSGGRCHRPYPFLCRDHPAHPQPAASSPAGGPGSRLRRNKSYREIQPCVLSRIAFTFASQLMLSVYCFSVIDAASDLSGGNLLCSVCERLSMFWFHESATDIPICAMAMEANLAASNSRMGSHLIRGPSHLGETTVTLC